MCALHKEKHGHASCVYESEKEKGKEKKSCCCFSQRLTLFPLTAFTSAWTKPFSSSLTYTFVPARSAAIAVLLLYFIICATPVLDAFPRSCLQEDDNRSEENVSLPTTQEANSLFHPFPSSSFQHTTTTPKSQVYSLFAVGASTTPITVSCSINIPKG